MNNLIRFPSWDFAIFVFCRRLSRIKGSTGLTLIMSFTVGCLSGCIMRHNTTRIGTYTIVVHKVHITQSAYIGQNNTEKIHIKQHQTLHKYIIIFSMSVTVKASGKVNTQSRIMIHSCSILTDCFCSLDILRSNLPNKGIKLWENKSDSPAL